jgi:hypothetical protein
MMKKSMFVLRIACVFVALIMIDTPFCHAQSVTNTLDAPEELESYSAVIYGSEGEKDKETGEYQFLVYASVAEGAPARFKITTDYEYIESPQEGVARSCDRASGRCEFVGGGDEGDGILMIIHSKQGALEIVSADPETTLIADYGSQDEMAEVFAGILLGIMERIADEQDEAEDNFWEKILENLETIGPAFGMVGVVVANRAPRVKIVETFSRDPSILALVGQNIVEMDTIVMTKTAFNDMMASLTGQPFAIETHPAWKMWKDTMFPGDDGWAYLYTDEAVGLVWNNRGIEGPVVVVTQAPPVDLDVNRDAKVWLSPDQMNQLGITDMGQVDGFTPYSISSHTVEEVKLAADTAARWEIVRREVEQAIRDGRDPDARRELRGFVDWLSGNNDPNGNGEVDTQIESQVRQIGKTAEQASLVTGPEALAYMETLDAKVDTLMTLISYVNENWKPAKRALTKNRLLVFWNKYKDFKNGLKGINKEFKNIVKNFKSRKGRKSPTRFTDFVKGLEDVRKKLINLRNRIPKQLYPAVKLVLKGGEDPITGTKIKPGFLLHDVDTQPGKKGKTYVVEDYNLLAGTYAEAEEAAKREGQSAYDSTQLILVQNTETGVIRMEKYTVRLALAGNEKVVGLIHCHEWLDTKAYPYMSNYDANVIGDFHRMFSSYGMTRQDDLLFGILVREGRKSIFNLKKKGNLKLIIYGIPYEDAQKVFKPLGAKRGGALGSINPKTVGPYLMETLHGRNQYAQVETVISTSEDPTATRYVVEEGAYSRTETGRKLDELILSVDRLYVEAGGGSEGQVTARATEVEQRVRETTHVVNQGGKKEVESQFHRARGKILPGGIYSGEGLSIITGHGTTPVEGTLWGTTVAEYDGVMGRLTQTWDKCADWLGGVLRRFFVEGATEADMALATSIDFISKLKAQREVARVEVGKVQADLMAGTITNADAQLAYEQITTTFLMNTGMTKTAMRMNFLGDVGDFVELAALGAMVFMTFDYFMGDMSGESYARNMQVAMYIGIVADMVDWADLGFFFVMKWLSAGLMEAVQWVVMTVLPMLILLAVIIIAAVMILFYYMCSELRYDSPKGYPWFCRDFCSLQDARLKLETERVVGNDYAETCENIDTEKCGCGWEYGPPETTEEGEYLSDFPMATSLNRKICNEYCGSRSGRGGCDLDDLTACYPLHVPCDREITVKQNEKVNFKIEGLDNSNCFDRAKIETVGGRGIGSGATCDLFGADLPDEVTIELREVEWGEEGWDGGEATMINWFKVKTDVKDGGLIDSVLNDDANIEIYDEGGNSLGAVRTRDSWNTWGLAEAPLYLEPGTYTLVAEEIREGPRTGLPIEGTQPFGPGTILPGDKIYRGRIKVSIPEGVGECEGSFYVNLEEGVHEIEANIYEVPERSMGTDMTGRERIITTTETKKVSASSIDMTVEPGENVYVDVMGDFVVAGTKDGVHAFVVGKGELWRYESEKAISSVSIDGNDVYAVVGRSTVVRLERPTGKPQEEYDLNDESGRRMSPLHVGAYEEIIAASTLENKVFMFSRQGENIRGRNPETADGISSISYEDHALAIGSGKSVFRMTGEDDVWKYALDYVVTAVDTQEPGSSEEIMTVSGTDIGVLYTFEEPSEAT